MDQLPLLEDILPFLSLSLLFPFSLSFSPFKGGVVTTRLYHCNGGEPGCRLSVRSHAGAVVRASPS